MILDTFIPELAFSSALSDITLVEVIEDITFELSYKQSDNSYKVVLSEPYTPDNDAMIYIIDLQKIIDGYLSDSPVLDFKFRFEGESDTIEYSSRILLSRAELDVDARKFVSQRFLSVMKGDKTIRPESLEYLSVYALESQVVNITASYRNNETGNYESDSFTVPNPVVNQITTIDVSPAKYAKEGKTLVKYTVSCGTRQMNYLIDNLSAPSLAEILFTNNFGVPETFSTSGNLARERKFENEYATIKGEYIKANNSFHIEHTANTGIMDQHTANWIESDLFSSYNTFLVQDMQIWKGITIIDQTVKRTSDKTEQPAYEFKYRLKQRNQEVTEFHKYLYRLFDPTFDKTYN
ncbi:hypothetical protein D0T84_16215 [Dysgonomonas sp. 521]|uniref:hypothetical protein n=1 Tax=Dysgonomonas sp. 521 TaxID=2302932 RepID=UPI0013D7B7ED|nr:hypothetical protein [Dysgonomonas sp. 521]NDV96446.1 hypothetical protein [Dysgonomonas sp. 521]